MIDPEYITELPVKDLKKGYTWDGESECFVCINCGVRFPRGVITDVEGTLLDAERTVRRHIAERHGSPLQVLLDMGKKHTGLSEIQKTIVELLYIGKTDREIAAETGNKAESTIRNHRYQLREKYREAKVYMAIKEILDGKDRGGKEFVHFHPHVTVHDERVMTTEDEAAGIIEKYFDGSKLLSFPKKEKRKLVILQHILGMLDETRRYTGKELDGELEKIFPDYATIRRYLVDYGFLNRTKDCTEYWVTES